MSAFVPPRPVPGLYRHFKGQHYRVLEVAQHSETQEPMVVYRALYGEHLLWVRPLAVFMELAEVDDRPVTRFVLLEPARLGDDHWA